MKSLWEKLSNAARDVDTAEMARLIVQLFTAATGTDARSAQFRELVEQHRGRLIAFGEDVDTVPMAEIIGVLCRWLFSLRHPGQPLDECEELILILKRASDDVDTMLMVCTFQRLFRLCGTKSRTQANLGALDPIFIGVHLGESESSILSASERIANAINSYQANFKNIEAARERIANAINSSAWDDIPAVLTEALWHLAELRPDFEELPQWISEAEDRKADQGVALKSTNLVENNRRVIRKLCQRYGERSEQNEICQMESRFVQGRVELPMGDLALFLTDVVKRALNFGNGVRKLSLAIEDNKVLIGRNTRISFNRTLRVPEDGKEYPLPAGFGRLPILRVEDYADRVPTKWLEEGGFIIPLYQREALFLEFSGVKWRPTIGKVAVGRVNAVSGKPYDLKIRAHLQDYVVIPDQRWLDGINSGTGTVKQFVAMPLGEGYTIEAQVTDEEKHGGFQIVVFDPKAGRFPERDPEELEAAYAYRKRRSLSARGFQGRSGAGAGDVIASRAPAWDADDHVMPAARTAVFGEEKVVEMGIAAGGTIEQQIHEDTYGTESWDESAIREIPIHIVNSAVYEQITGQKAPSSPITVESYQKHKIPWYSDYEEKGRAVAPAGIFKRILSIGRIDRNRGVASAEPSPKREIHPDEIVRIRTPSVEERFRSLVQRAQRSSQNQQYKIAVREASLALDLLTEQALPFQIRAHAHLCLGNALDAEADASACLAIEPNNLQALSVRTMASFHLGEYLLARNDAEKVLTQDPNAESPNAKNALFVHQQATLELSKANRPRLP
ncbi:MAG: hypothetical protein NTV08_19295 [Verrucomicrobia bacterium]|nr:hypothetical protein [Verrucomicrobiota bacterium]